MSVSASVFRTRVCYFKLHLTTILCPLSDGFCLIGLIALLMENYVIMMFLPSVSMLEGVIYLHICVQIRVEGRGYTDMDRCSLPYASQWVASIQVCTQVYGHGAWTWTGVTSPYVFIHCNYIVKRYKCGILNNILWNIHCFKKLRHLSTCLIVTAVMTFFKPLTDLKLFVNSTTAVSLWQNWVQYICIYDKSVKFKPKHWLSPFVNTSPGLWMGSMRSNYLQHCNRTLQYCNYSTVLLPDSKWAPRLKVGTF